MKDKLLYMVGGLVVGGLLVFFMGAGSNAGMLGGVSNMNSLTLSDDLVVDKTSTLTGAVSIVSGSITGAFDGGTFTESGGIRATSTTNATETLLASDFDVENYIDYTANINTTLTLPATTTFATGFLPNAGDTRQVTLRSATTTAATTLTLAAGTGIDLQFAEATGGDLVLNGLDVGVITFIRKANTDILALWNEYTEAD